MKDTEEKKTALFVELLIQHQRRLYSFIYTLIHNASDADDLLQKTNLVLWEKHEDYQQDKNFSAWATQIAYFQVRNHLRTKGRSRLCFNELVLSKIAGKQDEQQDVQTLNSLALVSCLEKLSPINQQLLKICYSGDESIQNVAKTLGRSPGSLYSTLDRIRSKLWDCIQRSLAEESRS